jgi:hypothetical protein
MGGVLPVRGPGSAPEPGGSSAASRGSVLLVRAVGILGALALAGTGCTSSGPAADSPTAEVSAGASAALATVQVQGKESFVVELSTPGLVEQARQMLEGEPAPGVLTGRVERDGAGPNAPWDWHLEPTTVAFRDQAGAGCNGLPSEVQNATLPSADYCPAPIEIVRLQPVPSP